MIAKILGVFWIFLGSIWIFKPEMLKNTFKKKISRSIRRAIYGFLFIFGIVMINSFFKTGGLLPKIVGILGIILTVKSIFLFMSKASDKLWSWWAERPLVIFKTLALVLIIVGVMLVRI